MTNQTEIERLTAEADKLGMSYGQYVSEQYKVKELNKRLAERKKQKAENEERA